MDDVATEGYVPGRNYLEGDDLLRGSEMVSLMAREGRGVVRVR